MPARVLLFTLLLAAPLAARADDLIVLLQQRNCPDCRLADVDLVHADLRDADLEDAQLRRTNLSGADLRGAEGLSKARLALACGDSATKLPDGMTIRPCVTDDKDD